METKIDHDEHQYIAAAKITSTDGLIPYKDYRFFHMPYSIFINAFIFQFTDHLLIGARTLNAVSFFLILVILFFTTFRAFDQQPIIFRLLAASAAVLLLSFNPVVKHAMGKSWTFDLPLMLTLGSFLLIVKTESLKRYPLYSFISGLLIAVAFGIRLQFAFLGVPIFLFLLIMSYKGKFQFNFKPIIHFIIGAVLGLTPLIILISISPDKFLFDIYMYHAVLDAQFFAEGLNLFQRIDKVIEILLDQSNFLIILLAIIYLGAGTYFQLFNPEKIPSRLYAVFLLVPFLIFIAVGKIVLYQYLYPLMVFLMIGTIFGMSYITKNQKYSVVTLIVFAFFSTLANGYFPFKNLTKVDQWEASNYNQSSHKIAELCGDAKILTLSPGMVLESKRIKIYKEFVTTPFLWRSSHLVPDELRKELNIVSPDNLMDFLIQDPPKAILVGFEPKDIEMPFVEYAKENNYTEMQFLEGILYLQNPKISFNQY
ncbi:MAG: hypothetical protein ACNS62_07845 [Candidatus Cyclobacteriaceae bacterium M3_2C_046]